MRRRHLALAVAAVLLAGLGAWFTAAANSLRSGEAASNIAVVDAEATAEVTAAVTNAVNRIFTYTHENTAATEQAASEVLRGNARGSYDALFAQVRREAPGQRLSVTTRVVDSAVRSLTGDSAEVLVFLDQSATREGASPGAAAAQLLVSVRREGERWVVIELEPR
ncbi:hypothetical protein [Prauserella endophytica]|uniref:Mce-associated membrane protein n=1 Tax=Prauserella endophytica TaxID=1592324 RepID=A0ABY2S8H0_9PSEU|nr:hypothetical protein [Prauserella endophytica]TKG71973.1 hypothetical protein FCN18_10885 [Prauserella endophytica]